MAEVAIDPKSGDIMLVAEGDRLIDGPSHVSGVRSAWPRPPADDGKQQHTCDPEKNRPKHIGTRPEDCRHTGCLQSRQTSGPWENRNRNPEIDCWFLTQLPLPHS